MMGVVWYNDRRRFIFTFVDKYQIYFMYIEMYFSEVCVTSENADSSTSTDVIYILYLPQKVYFLFCILKENQYYKKEFQVYLRTDITCKAALRLKPYDYAISFENGCHYIRSIISDKYHLLQNCAVQVLS